jgi:hypothetical protein
MRMMKISFYPILGLSGSEEYKAKYPEQKDKGEKSPVVGREIALVSFYKRENVFHKKDQDETAPLKSPGGGTGKAFSS